MRANALRPERLAACVCALLVGLVAATPALAQWKWRDARGQIHVSDTPPPRDVPDKDVLQRPEAPARKSAAPAAPPASAASAAAPAKAPVDNELEQRKRLAEQEQAAKQKAEERKLAELRAENCRRAKEQLALMDSGVRVTRIKPNGEIEYLDDTQRAESAQRARQAIAVDCQR
jgi:hypothetical protein